MATSPGAESSVLNTTKKVPLPHMASTSALPPPRVYNAIYSAVQVYECMVRGIAVMRRRADSYVNATQILKVAGIDKGRRTKILEKEILPGKHEIVQGGYGKYQGTWIPLERGREIANQYGVASLLAPLFDYIPPTPSVPHRMSGAVPTSVHRPFYSPQGISSPHFGSPGGIPYHSMPTPHIPPQTLPRGSPFVPQSFPSLVNASATSKATIPRSQALGAPPQIHTAYLYPGSPNPYTSPRPLVGSSLLKRPRDDGVAAVKKDISDRRPASGGPLKPLKEDGTKAPPTKRPRTDMSPLSGQHRISQVSPQPNDATANRGGLPEDARSSVTLLKNAKRRALVASMSHDADPVSIIQLLKRHDAAGSHGVDAVLDEQGHTALHFAASLSRLSLVQALVENQADVCRGNNAGETPLMRCVLSVASFRAQTFPNILGCLATSISTLDLSSRSVLHHIALAAGVKQRASAAQYYMECVLEHVARHKRDDDALKKLVDSKDIHGDTALNLAARIGNQTLARNLLDIGADIDSCNNLGLRPVDFGPLHASSEPSPNFDASVTSSVGDTTSFQEGNVIGDLVEIIQSMSAELSAAVTAKLEQLDSVRAELRAATRELAQHRHEVQKLQLQDSASENIPQKIDNIERALEDEATYAWASGAKVGTPKPENARTANLMRIDNGDHALASSSPDFRGPSRENGTVFQLPSANTLDCLIKLRKMRAWQSRLETMLSERSVNLKERSTEKELQYKQIVSLCTGQSLERVDEVLESLITAMESEGSSPEPSRIASFMQKVSGRMAIT